MLMSIGDVNRMMMFTLVQEFILKPFFYLNSHCLTFSMLHHCTVGLGAVADYYEIVIMLPLIASKKIYWQWKV